MILTGTASGGTAPYTYQWSSSIDGTLGAGAVLTIPGLHNGLHDSNWPPNVITLSVTDANGLQSTATVDVTVYLQTYLPVVLRAQ
jgi:hypothetical protein